MKSPRWVKLALALCVLTVTTAVVFGQWLSDQIIKPLIVAWLWLVFYLTHLPQLAVWSVTLALLSLSVVKAFASQRPQRPTARPRRDDQRPKGPVSHWHHTLALAMQGSLYRHKLREQLLALAAEKESLSATTVRFLDSLKHPQRLRLKRRTEVDAFARALNQALDELAPINGDHDGNF